MQNMTVLHIMPTLLGNWLQLGSSKSVGRKKIYLRKQNFQKVGYNLPSPILNCILKKETHGIGISGNRFSRSLAGDPDAYDASPLSKMYSEGNDSLKNNFGLRDMKILTV